MKLAIVGSRNFTDYNKFLDIVQKYFREEIDEIISGGAYGADSLAYRFAKNWKIPFQEFTPNWEKYGKKAGIIRNQKIVDRADIVIAFWDGFSKGTKDTLNKAEQSKKPTFIIYF